MSADALLDHLVGAQQQRLRDLEPERFGGLEVDHEVVPGWLLHRKLARLRPLEDLVDVDGRTPEHVVEARPVRNQSPIADQWCVLIHRRNVTHFGEVEDALPVEVRERIRHHEQRIRALAIHRRERVVEIVGTASLRSSSRFALSAVALSVTPVTFPPGLARLATNPTPSGSPERAMTIGMVELASLAAAAAGEPKVMIKSTLRPTSSAANAGSSSRLASAQRPS